MHTTAKSDVQRVCGESATSEGQETPKNALSSVAAKQTVYEGMSRHIDQKLAGVGAALAETRPTTAQLSSDAYAARILHDQEHCERRSRN